MRDTGMGDDVTLGALAGLLGYRLRRVQVVVFEDFARVMADEADGGVTPGQFGVMALIAANPGLKQTALARGMGVERSTMVAVIDALEKRGLVLRKDSAEDRRSHALVLTAEGARSYERWLGLVLGHERRIAECLSDVEREQLLDLLTRLDRRQLPTDP